MVLSWFYDKSMYLCKEERHKMCDADATQHHCHASQYFDINNTLFS